MEWMIVSLNNPKQKVFLIIFLDDGFPLINQWNIVHSIALNEDAPLLCGADRENYRIQCVNSNTGEFQRQIHVEAKDNIGPIYAIEFPPNTNGLSKKKIIIKRKFFILFRNCFICCYRWDRNINKKSLYDRCTNWRYFNII